jgi:hypothetical protein
MALKKQDCGGQDHLEVIARLEHLEDRQRAQRTTQDTVLTEQADMKRKINEIHHCLVGDEYTKMTNGGIVREVKTLKTDVERLKIWRIRLVTAGTIVSALVSFLGALIISQWHHTKDIIK